jgi:hypothetical protein
MVEYIQLVKFSMAGDHRPVLLSPTDKGIFRLKENFTALKTHVSLLSNKVRRQVLLWYFHERPPGLQTEGGGQTPPATEAKKTCMCVCNNIN